MVQPNHREERRHVPERRTLADRRDGDRRMANVPVETDRRTESLRSGIERRKLGERRRALTEFSERVHELVITPGARVICPSCDGDLVLRGLIARGSSVASLWELECSSCGRSALVRGVTTGSA
jgi:hypothetical protein